MKKRIVFVCNGNIHRSVIASESLRKILKEREIGRGFSVGSFGLQGTKGTRAPKHRSLSEYPKEWKAAKPTLEKLGIDIRKHRFKKISMSAIEKTDVVIAMDEKTYSKAGNSLMNQFPNHTEKIRRFSDLTMRGGGIKDPAGKGSERVHKKIIEDIYSTLVRKYEDVLMWTKC